MRCCVKHPEGAVELWTIQQFVDFARFLRCPCEAETREWFLWGPVNECVDEVKYLFKSCWNHGSWACSLFPFCPWEGRGIHLLWPWLWDCISLWIRDHLSLCYGQIFGSTAAPGCPPGVWTGICRDLTFISSIFQWTQSLNMLYLMFTELVLPELPPRACLDAINPHLQRHWDISSFCCWDPTFSFRSPW